MLLDIALPLEPSGQWLKKITTVEMDVDSVGTNPDAKHGNRPPSGALYGGADGLQHKTERIRDLALERLLLCTLPDGLRMGPNGLQ